MQALNKLMRRNAPIQLVALILLQSVIGRIDVCVTITALDRKLKSADMAQPAVGQALPRLVPAEVFIRHVESRRE